MLSVLQEKQLTLRPEKCKLGKPKVKWFGHIYSKDGMSPDPEKCKVIKDWPEPTTIADVKSFLQTVQFNSKFLAGRPREPSYPELTEPLRALTKKGAKFVWTRRESSAFQQIKERLCRMTILAPYDVNSKTRLYVDSSPVGTQASVAQLDTVDGEEHWRPVNHTSRP